LTNHIRRIPKGEVHTMKKMMTMVLGLALTFGAVSVAFAQDAPPKKQKGTSKKKGGKKKSGDDTKKDAGK